MAIAARTRPNVIVLGSVISTSEQRKREDNELYAYSVMIAAGAGNLYIRYWLRSIERGAKLPLPGTTIAVVVSVGESERNGAELAYDRDLTSEDLDLIVSSSNVPELATK